MMAITTFAIQIFKQAGTNASPEFCALLIGFVNVISTVVAGEVHTYFDRKPTLGISSMFVVNLHVFIAVFFFAVESDGEMKHMANDYSFLLVVLILMFYVAFAVGPGSIAFMYMGEGLPTHLKAIGSSIGSSFNTLTVVTSTLLFDKSLLSLGYPFTFLALAFLTALSSAVAYCLMVETRGKTSSEIDGYYSINKKKLS